MKRGAATLPWNEHALCVMAPPHLNDWAARAREFLVHAGFMDGVAFATSGSSGSLPKAILFTRHALNICAAGAIKHMGAQSGDWCCPLPIWHVGGAMIHMRAALSGVKVHSFNGKWNPHDYTRLMSECGAQWSSLVPTQVIDLIKADCRAPQSVKCIIVGGGALDESTGRKARELGWPVVQSYGLTESGSQLATALPDEPYHTDRLTVLPHWQVSATDDGVLRFKGEGMLYGRLLTQDSGEFTLERHPPDDWCTTCDRVELDGRLLTFLRRADRLIKVLGELIDPDAVQSGLRAHAPDAVVESIPHPRSGRELVVCGPDADALRRACAVWNAAAPGPQRVNALLVTDIPLTVMGKLDRTALKNALASAEKIERL